MLIREVDKLVSSGKMRKLVQLFMIIAILGGLASTNPGMDQYVEWGMLKLNQEMQGQTPAADDPLGQLKQTIIKWGINRYGPDYIRENTRVNNYIVLSVFTTEFNGERIKVLGIVNHFVPISREKI